MTINSTRKVSVFVDLLQLRVDLRTLAEDSDFLPGSEVFGFDDVIGQEPLRNEIAGTIFGRGANHEVDGSQVLKSKKQMMVVLWHP